MFSFLPRDVAESICKLAFNETPEGPVEEPAPPPPKPTAWDKMKPYASAVGGSALGVLSGAGAMHIADQVHRHYRGGAPLPLPARAIMPLAGGAAGLLYNIASQKQQEELNRVRESEQHHAQGRGV